MGHSIRLPSLEQVPFTHGVRVWDSDLSGREKVQRSLSQSRFERVVLGHRFVK